MLYEWINSNKVNKPGSNAQLDGNATVAASVSEMVYYNQAEEGWRANGWYQMDGSEDVGTDGDTDWYYVDDGDIKHANVADDYATNDDEGAVYVARIKVEGKYFAFNEKGQMQDGLQYIKKDGAFYYFDENGYQKTGKIASVECDDDDYTFYFNTKNGKNGQGYTGEKDGYLYFNGKRLEADDDYRLYYLDGDVYLVNNKGKVQKSNKKYDIENKGIAAEDVEVTFTSSKSKKVATVGGKAVATLLAEVNWDNNNVTEDQKISVPFIQLYDDDVYTYTEADHNVTAWRGLNK